MPLASIAAVALSGRLPRLLAEPRFDSDGLSAARGDERPEELPFWHQITPACWRRPGCG